MKFSPPRCSPSDPTCRLADLESPDPRPVWAALDAAGAHRFSGEMRLGTEPELTVWFSQGSAYYASTSTDPTVGDRLVGLGVLTADDLARGEVRIGEISDLSRLFRRVPSLDRDTVEVALEMLTATSIGAMASTVATGVRVANHRHHASGIHTWTLARTVWDEDLADALGEALARDLDEDVVTELEAAWPLVTVESPPVEQDHGSVGTSWVPSLPGVPDLSDAPVVDPIGEPALQPSVPYLASSPGSQADPAPAAEVDESATDAVADTADEPEMQPPPVPMVVVAPVLSPRPAVDEDPAPSLPTSALPTPALSTSVRATSAQATPTTADLTVPTLPELPMRPAASLDAGTAASPEPVLDLPTVIQRVVAEDAAPASPVDAAPTISLSLTADEDDGAIPDHVREAVRAALAEIEAATRPLMTKGLTSRAIEEAVAADAAGRPASDQEQPPTHSHGGLRRLIGHRTR